MIKFKHKLINVAIENAKNEIAMVLFEMLDLCSCEGCIEDARTVLLIEEFSESEMDCAIMDVASQLENPLIRENLCLCMEWTFGRLIDEIFEIHRKKLGI